MERNWVRSRPEDFLPSEPQRKGYETWLSRSAVGQWEEVGGIKESGDETVLRNGIQGAKAPSRRAVATATQRNVPEISPALVPMTGRGHEIESTMPVVNIKPLPDTGQAQRASTVPPLPAWPPEASNFRTATHPADHMFFEGPLSLNPQFTRSSTAYDHDYMEALAEDMDRDLRAENRQRGIINQDDNRGLLFADLLTFETGEPYDPNLGQFFRDSGFGE